MSGLDKIGRDYAEDSDSESALSQAMRELNPAGSSMTHSQAREAAGVKGLCSDGSPCGAPHFPEDDPYCAECPNAPDTSSLRYDAALTKAADAGLCASPDECSPLSDSGAHYRREYKGIKLDPYRIAEIYAMRGGPREQIMKKCLRFTEKGQTEQQVVSEIRAALNRWQEMLEEDGE